MEINDVLFFDTETTGIPERTAKWDIDFMQYPHIVQIAWIFDGHEESHIIRPEGWEIPQEAVDVHGITTEYAREHGELFETVINKFIWDCRIAGLICGHNIHFDTGIVKANILRELGQEYYDAQNVETALYKGKRIDTMRSSMKWVDARMANGRLKFPNLSELFSRCFPGATFDAHDALEDTRAVKRCLPVLVGMQLVELKVKEYPDSPGDISESSKTVAQSLQETGKAAAIAADAVKKFGASAEKAGIGPLLNTNEKDGKFRPRVSTPEFENSAKITADLNELLNENEF